MLKQVLTASNGAGNATAVGSAKQAPDGGRKAAEMTVPAPRFGEAESRRTLLAMDPPGVPGEQPTGDLAVSNEEQIAGQRATLAEKLVASQKNPKKGTVDPSASSAELFKIMETVEKTESAYLDRVGRRLQTMLDAVKSAKNVAKPVQQALAEAIEALKHAKAARDEQQEVRNIWLTKADDERRRLVTPGTSANVGGIDPSSTDNLAIQFSSLRSEVGELSKAVRQLVESKPDGRTGATKRIQGQKTPAEDSEEALATEPWTEVVKKTVRKKKSQTQGEQTNGAQESEDTAKAKPRVRARPKAIIVDVNPADFPALATKIRGGVDRGVIGDSITGMRQAKAGGLLIKVRGDQAQFEAVRAEISRSAGCEVEVRALQQRVVVEIRDLDQWSTTEEVAEATASATGIPSEQVRVFNLRKRYGGSQSVLASLPQEASRKLTNTGRLRIGVISCRVRTVDVSNRSIRCFRCLTFGHTAAKCEGPDRTECCRRCGESGHKAASCSATEQAAGVFAKVVQGSKSMPSAGSYRSGGATEDQHAPPQ